VNYVQEQENTGFFSKIATVLPVPRFWQLIRRLPGLPLASTYKKWQDRRIIMLVGEKHGYNCQEWLLIHSI